MLVLSRKPGQKVAIGGGVTVTVVGVEGRRVTLGIDAPGGLHILRGELRDAADHPLIVWSEPEPDAPGVGNPPAEGPR